MTKRFVVLTLTFALFILQSQSAFACGGLVAPDGDVRLERATTLVAWHDGIEHYMTSFTYHADVANLGWIVPLPTVPLKIEAGGAWTLQRLFRETHPQVERVEPLAASAAMGSAQVLEQVKIEALNITVIKGNGQEVLNWATGNGFFLNSDTHAHLLNYANGSPIFMAAKYDNAEAKARHQLVGDGAPILITMKTAHPWVPLEVLALDDQQVQADLYMLTDRALTTSDLNAKIGQPSVGSEIPGAPGFKVEFQEQVSDQLYHDLSTDRNMSWVPKDSWLTYLSLDAPEVAVTYDLGVSSNGVIRLAPYGTPPMAVGDGPRKQSDQLPASLPTLPMGTPERVLTLVLILAFVASTIWFFRRRGRAKESANIDESLTQG
ncbi:MAG TPA: DUF2330 domain-containing protein [Ktedonobacteraceae bacterium]|jgi:hypothetical protein|nr:DUF2330 domain-containing protein [Ktedonobacteraceae bacterium]